MPYRWEEPEIFMVVDTQAGAFKVYHCYDDEGHQRCHWFTVDPSDCNVDSVIGESQFDVSDLAPVDNETMTSTHWREDRIRKAATDGILTADGLNLVTV